jgi:hypothetical protein
MRSAQDTVLIVLAVCLAETRERRRTMLATARLPTAAI